ncbi:MAG: hypothetical protein R2862_06935 [Thermoanaerobaculia bacterium]
MRSLTPAVALPPERDPPFRQVVGERRLEPQPFPGARVGELELPGVQRDAWRRREAPAPRGPRRDAAVGRIAGDRVPEMEQVHPDLVGPPGPQIELDQ